MDNSRQKIGDVRLGLFKKLEAEHALWSYDTTAMDFSAVSDEQLIALTMRYLDLSEIKLLFTIFSKKKIKDAWRKLLVPEGEYLYTLNRFFAWYYFDAKHPDAYLKSLLTRHLNRLPE